MTELLQEFLAVLMGALFGLMFGLWLGERGRRIDAQLREVGRPVVKPEPAKELKQRDDLVGDDELAVDMRAVREKYIEDCMAETGCSRELAELDADRAMAQLYA